ncbi:MAG TPA: GNAT family N-acetyltransferase [Kofleriaceae bacterium]|nr:GNAT family N-acetyltransferase [Kofleriaceae bacterium]
MTRTVGPPRGRSEIDAFSDVLTDSLNFPPRGQVDFMSRYEATDVRVVRAGDRVTGGLVYLPTGQYFGGQRIPMTGIHAVAIAPEERGTGVGRLLLQETTRELARPGGPPIACLYPATQPIYRSVGFEQAGTYTQYRVPIAALPVGPHDLAVERLPPDVAVVADRLGPIYGRFARRQNGFVDRSEWFWRRQVDPLSGETRAVYAVREQGAITAYATLRRRWQVGGQGHMSQDVLCRELVAETPAAARRLVTLIADDRSLGQHLVIQGPPSWVDAMLLVEQSLEVDMQLRWMLRILDVAGALEARGYPPGLAITVGFEVDDDLVDRNRGRFSLEVSGGRGRVTRGGAGERSVALGVRALAALFSGYLPAEELARAGMAAGAGDALAAATAVFAGPAPWLAEIF